MNTDRPVLPSGCVRWYCWKCGQPQPRQSQPADRVPHLDPELVAEIDKWLTLMDAIERDPNPLRQQERMLAHASGGVAFLKMILRGETFSPITTGALPATMEGATLRREALS